MILDSNGSCDLFFFLYINFTLITGFKYRCEKPWTLLKDIRQKIVSGGFLVIAVVFPFSPYIDDHGKVAFKVIIVSGTLYEVQFQFITLFYLQSGRAGRRPVEHLDIRRSTPERSINAFYKNVAERLGMSIVVSNMFAMNSQKTVLLLFLFLYIYTSSLKSD